MNAQISWTSSRVGTTSVIRKMTCRTSRRRTHTRNTTQTKWNGTTTSSKTRFQALTIQSTTQVWLQHALIPWKWSMSPMVSLICKATRTSELFRNKTLNCLINFRSNPNLINSMPMRNLKIVPNQLTWWKLLDWQNIRKNMRIQEKRWTKQLLWVLITSKKVNW